MVIEANLGSTSLYTGVRVSKANFIIQALGDADELTSNIGLCMEHCRQNDQLSLLVDQLFFIQCRIQELNSHIATINSKGESSLSFDQEGKLTLQIENWIDEMDVKLTPLSQFILPVKFQRFPINSNPIFVI